MAEFIRPFAENDYVSREGFNNRIEEANIALTEVQSGAAPAGHTHTAAQVGAVPNMRKINTKVLNADITLSAGDVGAAPASHTHTPAEAGAAAADHTHTAAQVGAVPTTRKVNGKALSGDITLAAGDVGAAAASHTHTAAQVGAAAASHTHPTDASRAPVASPVFTGTPKAPVATDYGTARLRNIYAGTGDMTPGTTKLDNGVLYLVYE